MAFLNVAIGLSPIATFANDAIRTILHFFLNLFEFFLKFFLKL